ncbi:hypothetical protein MFRU_010g00590 [Monilinia fructicola]|uniref:Yeast cell wall synthesis Kre9/Knh1-like N-terminal domain-containing protein n=1 Tax=Monilinia fructicola TaxID=38448 RepID=A0A5M9JGI6_MONFR|nr:hypothetical protein EYC84_008318 [Monilinia fructicola]KAG4030929.1 hypothetical protein MFRU_010g00590 [Monilinia fructicola]
MARYALAFAALVAIAQAISITSPSTDGKWDLSTGAQTITWTSVNTDPTTVDIYLVHMASNPPLNDKLFSNVDITKGSESVSGLQLPTGSDYQINFVSPGKPEQILAQSQQFTVDGVAASASSTLAGYTGSATTGTSTSTSTGSSTTVTGTSTSTESSSSTGTGLVTSASGSKTSTASASKTSTASGNGAAATGVPMIGLLAGAAALLL